MSRSTGMAGSTRLRTPALTALVVVLLVVFLIVPVCMVIRTGFQPAGGSRFYWLGRVFANPVLVRQLVNGLLLGCVTTCLSLMVAIPLAILSVRCRFRGRSFLSVLVLMPMILPPFVGAMAMRRLLCQFGVVNLLLERVGLMDFGQSLPPDWLGGGFVAVVILQVLHLFPIAYLNASAALANIDQSYVHAARNLGAGPIRTFLTVTLPLMRPGLFTGGTIVFIWAFTDIGTPLIIGYHDLAPVTVFKELARAEIDPRTYSLVFVVLASSVLLYVLGKFLFGRSVKAESAKATTVAQMYRLGPVATTGAWVLLGGIVLLALLPHLTVLLTAVSRQWVGTVLPSEYTLEHLRFVLTGGTATRAILNSLKYAGASTLIDIGLGALAAWLIVRSKIAGRTLLDGLVMLPLAVPGIILAAGYVAITAKGSWLEAIGPMKNPFIILVIAYAIRRLPFMVRGISAGLEQVPESLEEAARNLGSSRLGTALRITVPLLAANIIAAAVLTFSFAMLEVSDSLILAQVQSDYPITKEIYSLAASGNVDAAGIASALGVCGMCILSGSLGLAAFLLRGKLGAIFRA